MHGHSKSPLEVVPAVACNSSPASLEVFLPFARLRSTTIHYSFLFLFSCLYLFLLPPPQLLSCLFHRTVARVLGTKFWSWLSWCHQLFIICTIVGRAQLVSSCSPPTRQHLPEVWAERFAVEFCIAMRARWPGPELAGGVFFGVLAGRPEIWGSTHMCSSPSICVWVFGVVRH